MRLLEMYVERSQVSLVEQKRKHDTMRGRPRIEDVLLAVEETVEYLNDWNQWREHECIFRMGLFHGIYRLQTRIVMGKGVDTVYLGANGVLYKYSGRSHKKVSHGEARRIDITPISTRLSIRKLCPDHRRQLIDALIRLRTS